MSEKFLRRLFIYGSVFFLGVLSVMTWDSMRQIGAGRTPPLTADVIAGKHVWQQRNCNDCHTILGIGGYYAPELTRITDRRDDVWLARYLRDPQGTKPGTTMPRQELTDADISHLIAFHHWVAAIQTNGWPPAPRMSLSSASGASGELVFRQKGCTDCHAVRGTGQNVGPDLTHVATRADVALLYAWLDDPDAVKPGTVMPRTPLAPGERDALLLYLASLK